MTDDRPVVEGEADAALRAAAKKVDEAWTVRVNAYDIKSYVALTSLDEMYERLNALRRVLDAEAALTRPSVPEADDDLFWTCGIDGCEFTVEPGEGRTMVYHRHEDHPAAAPFVPVVEGEADAAVAQLFHEAYEQLAPRFGYRTRQESAKPWADVPETNKALMVATVHEVRAALTRRAAGPLDVERLRQDLEAKRKEYLDFHEQSLRDAEQFGPKAGAHGRWNARAEGIDTALELLAARLPVSEDPTPREDSPTDLRS